MIKRETETENILPIKEFSGEFRFLSNFWTVEVELDGEVYPSVENAYQAAKFSDRDERQEFKSLTPGQAKRRGSVPMPAVWQIEKLAVMETLLRCKFSHQELKNKLIETGSRELIEGNTWGDRHWGVCDGKGSNHLGRILMQIRAELNAKDLQS